MLYFYGYRRLAAPEALDPFIVAENPQRLGDRLIEAAGAHLDRVFNSLEIDAANFHVFRTTLDDYHVRFLSATRRSKSPVLMGPLPIFGRGF
jgi:hypothetical protein